MRNGIPYRCPKREFGLFTNRITSDVTAFMVFLQDQKSVEAFKQICYKGGFYLDKKTIEIACKTVQSKNITFVQALREQAKRFPKIRGGVAAFDSFCRTATCLKAKTLLRYLDTNGYGAYMQKNQMDRNTFELLLELAEEDPPIPVFLKQLDQLKQQIERHSDGDEGIILTTAHSAKGLEYDTVYIIDLYDGRFPGAPMDDTSGRKDDMDANEEERRLFYVAMTRAKNQLFLLTIKGRESSFAETVKPIPKPQRAVTPAIPRVHEKNYQQILTRQQEALHKKREAERINPILGDVLVQSSHILDEDRRVNAQRFEAAFYANPDMRAQERQLRAQSPQQQPQDVLELAKLLSANPALATLLAGILKNGTA